MFIMSEVQMCWLEVRQFIQGCEVGRKKAWRARRVEPEGVQVNGGWNFRCLKPSSSLGQVASFSWKKSEMIRERWSFSTTSRAFCKLRSPGQGLKERPLHRRKASWIFISKLERLMIPLSLRMKGAWRVYPGLFTINIGTEDGRDETRSIAARTASGSICAEGTAWNSRAVKLVVNKRVSCGCYYWGGLLIS